jgi:hypothetical protein
MTIILVIVIVIVLGKSQVIYMRGSYSDGCRWQHVRWCLA